VNGLEREHSAYLFSLNEEQDSLELFKAKFYLQYEKDSLFFNSFSKCSDLFIDDSLALNYATLYFLRKNEGSRDKWFELLRENVKLDTTQFIHLYNQLDYPIFFDSIHIPDELKNDFVKYQKAYKKKPIVSLLLSAIVPGLGELYIGNLRASIAKFSSQTIFGIQIVESIAYLGLLHPLPVLNIGFFSAFYVANIVGSYRDTKTKKVELKNQFYIHAADYYSTIVSSALYR
jgi:TM2 domain-containing membrane protein YozV